MSASNNNVIEEAIKKLDQLSFEQVDVNNNQMVDFKERKNIIDDLGLNWGQQRALLQELSKTQKVEDSGYRVNATHMGTPMATERALGQAIASYLQPDEVTRANEEAYERSSKMAAATIEPPKQEEKFVPNIAATAQKLGAVTMGDTVAAKLEERGIVQGLSTMPLAAPAVDVKDKSVELMTRDEKKAEINRLVNDPVVYGWLHNAGIIDGKNPELQRTQTKDYFLGLINEMENDALLTAYVNQYRGIKESEQPEVSVTPEPVAVAPVEPVGAAVAVAPAPAVDERAQLLTDIRQCLDEKAKLMLSSVVEVAKPIILEVYPERASDFDSFNIPDGISDEYFATLTKDKTIENLREIKSQVENVDTQQVANYIRANPDEFKAQLREIGVGQYISSLKVLSSDRPAVVIPAEETPVVAAGVASDATVSTPLPRNVMDYINNPMGIVDDIVAQAKASSTVEPAASTAVASQPAVNSVETVVPYAPVAEVAAVASAPAVEEPGVWESFVGKLKEVFAAVVGDTPIQAEPKVGVVASADAAPVAEAAAVVAETPVVADPVAQVEGDKPQPIQLDTVGGLDEFTSFEDFVKGEEQKANMSPVIQAAIPADSLVASTTNDSMCVAGEPEQKVDVYHFRLEDDVERIQAALNGLDSNLKVDGMFGQGTAKATFAVLMNVAEGSGLSAQNAYRYDESMQKALQNHIDKLEADGNQNAAQLYSELKEGLDHMSIYELDNHNYALPTVYGESVVNAKVTFSDPVPCEPVAGTSQVIEAQKSSYAMRP